MLYSRFNRQSQMCSDRFPSWIIMGVLMIALMALCLSGCQKSETNAPAGAPQKAAAPAAPKDTGAPDSNDLNYEKAMAKQYPENAPINVTGKVMQLVDDKNILVATRKDDVFGYLDNIVTINFPDKPAVGVGDIIQIKTQNAGIKKYKTEGKGEYDAPFLKGGAMTILEKGKPTK